jgi:hypothetical protein
VEVAVASRACFQEEHVLLWAVCLSVGWSHSRTFPYGRVCILRFRLLLLPDMLLAWWGKGIILCMSII